jgi:hypothetical protein
VSIGDMTYEPERDNLVDDVVDHLGPDGRARRAGA